MDIDAIAERSFERVAAAIPADPDCPWCAAPMAVRRTQIGWISEDETRAYIDGVQFKCAGGGCGFRPDFDVTIREGRGVWPSLTGREEFERELELRDGQRGVDMALDADADPAASVRDRLAALGYLE